MHKRKDVLTTGQVAQICNVAPRTVTKWFDSGQLKGYRIPGSRDRRIPTNELVRFMKAHHIPTDAVEANHVRVLIIDSDWQWAEDLASALEAKANYQTQTAQNSFDAGVVAQKFLPHVIIISLMVHDVDAKGVCKYIRTNEDLNGTRIIAIANNLTEMEIDALHQQGFDGVITNPADINHVLKTIREAIAIIY